YAFTAEKRARQQFDEANAPPEVKPEPPPRNHVNGVASTDSPTPSSTSLINEVLQPCAAPPATLPLPKPQPSAMKDVSFEEFEGRGTVFDELEWMTIDDKEALSQVLGNASLSSRPESTSSANSVPIVGEVGLKPLHSLTNNGKSATLSAIPPYPVLDFGEVLQPCAAPPATLPLPKPQPSAMKDVSFEEFEGQPAVSLSTTGGLNRAAFSKPANSVPPPANHVTPTPVRHESPLRVRLLTKGYRENLVSVAMDRLPRERLPHIEYYMKGMSILEKKGVDVTMTVKFLLDSHLTDKQNNFCNFSNSSPQIPFVTVAPFPYMFYPDPPYTCPSLYDTLRTMCVLMTYQRNDPRSSHMISIVQAEKH
ncbi:unnamed protein product, partial [Strongylus vulgaris]